MASGKFVGNDLRIEFFRIEFYRICSENVFFVLKMKITKNKNSLP